MDRQLTEALQVLGIPPGSGQEQVLAAYRRLARSTHPDMSSAPDAAARFAALTTAYQLASAASRPQPNTEQTSTRPSDRKPRTSGYDQTEVVSSGATRRRVTGDLLRAPAGSAASRLRRPPIVAGPVIVRPPPHVSRGGS